MKRLLILTFIAAMVFTLSGCGGVPEEKLTSVQDKYTELASLYEDMVAEMTAVKSVAAAAGVTDTAELDAAYSELGILISDYGNDIANNLASMSESDVDALLAGLTAANSQINSQMSEIKSLRAELEQAVSAAAQPDDADGQPGGADGQYEYVDQQFQLTNYTGVDIYRMYVSPSDTESWEEDVLGNDVLFDEDTVNVTFSIYEDAQFWDLRIEDQAGNKITWLGLDLFSIASIELYWDGQSATAAVS